MVKPPTAANWMLVVPALPLALTALLILFDLPLALVASALVFSMAVGCATLLIDGVLIIKGTVSLGQWRVLASIILAAVDVALPPAILALVGHVLRGLLKML